MKIYKVVTRTENESYRFYFCSKKKAIEYAEKEAEYMEAKGYWIIAVHIEEGDKESGKFIEKDCIKIY